MMGGEPAAQAGEKIAIAHLGFLADEERSIKQNFSRLVRGFDDMPDEEKLSLVAGMDSEWQMLVASISALATSLGHRGFDAELEGTEAGVDAPYWDELDELGKLGTSESEEKIELLEWN